MTELGTLSATDQRRLDELDAQLAELNDTFIGYPCNGLFDYSPLFRFLRYSFNNVGDPYVASNYRLNTHDFEREVLDIFRRLTRAPDDSIWGYVTGGGTEGNITIADRFDGLRHMPDGEISPVIIALKRMKNPGYMKWFDPVIYPFFMQTVPPFAPGDQVTLNNRQPVVVTEFNEKEPCRPVVRPIDLSLAEKPDVTNTVKEPDINLALRTDLYIKNIGDLDVTKYLF